MTLAESAADHHNERNTATMGILTMRDAVQEFYR